MIIVDTVMGHYFLVHNMHIYRQCKCDWIDVRNGMGLCFLLHNKHFSLKICNWTVEFTIKNVENISYVRKLVATL